MSIVDYKGKYYDLKAKLKNLAHKLPGHLKHTLQQGGASTEIIETQSLAELKAVFHNKISESINLYGIMKLRMEGVTLPKDDGLYNTWEMFALGKRGDGRYIYESHRGIGSAGRTAAFEKAMGKTSAEMGRSSRKFRYLYDSMAVNARTIGNKLLNILEEKDSKGNNIVLTGKVWRRNIEDGQCGKRFDFYINSAEQGPLLKLMKLSREILDTFAGNVHIRPLTYCEMNFPMNFLNLSPDEYARRPNRDGSVGPSDDKAAYRKNYDRGKVEYILMNVKGFQMTYRNDSVDVITATLGARTMSREVILEILAENHLLMDYYRSTKLPTYGSNSERDTLLNGMQIEKLVYDKLYREVYEANQEYSVDITPLIDLML